MFRRTLTSHEGGILSACLNKIPACTVAGAVEPLREFLNRRRVQRLVVVSHATPVTLLSQMVCGEELTTTGPFWIGVENCCVRRWPKA